MGAANSGRRITVVGAGIGGLTAALAFARSGAEVTVLEQAQALTEVGAGVQITPNGMAVMAALGLGADVAARSVRAARLCPTDALTGRTLVTFDVSERAYHFFYRPDLIDVLAEGCAAAGVRVCTGFRVTTGSTGVDLGQGLSGDHSQDHSLGPAGSNPTEAADAGSMVRADLAKDPPPDLIVGADGIHSNLRQRLNGADAPFFTGQVAWRAIIPHADAAPVARVWMAPGRHVVTYPLRGDRLNIVAVREQANWAPAGWHLPDAPAAMQAAFAETGSDLRDILGRVTETRLWGLFRHPVAAHWHGVVGVGATQRPVAILGDSAHPTLPFLAQGANLAIEDAWVLAACCAGSTDLSEALAKYQAVRSPRVTRAIKAADTNGARFHMSGTTRKLGQLYLRTMGVIAPKAITSSLDWLYTHDVTAA